MKKIHMIMAFGLALFLIMTVPAASEPSTPGTTTSQMPLAPKALPPLPATTATTSQATLPVTQQPAAIPPTSTPPTTQPIAVLPISPVKTLAPIASELGQTLQTLVGVPTSQMAAPTAIDNGDDNAGQINDTFATALLNTFLTTLDALRKNNDGITVSATAGSDFATWWQAQTTDPRRQKLWQMIGGDLWVIVGIPLLCSIAASLMLLPLRLNLGRKQPTLFGERLKILLTFFMVRMVPLIVFLGASLLLLDQNESRFLPRFVILNVIYAITLSTGVQQILHTLFVPTLGHLRLLKFDDRQALYACRWFSAFAILIIYGYFFIDMATALRMPVSVIALFQNTLAIILTVMAIIVIVQVRVTVSALLRGNLPRAENAVTDTTTQDTSAPLGSPSAAPAGWLHTLRMRVARHWHSFAIAYLVIGMGITVLGINNGLALMLRGTILTLVILTALRGCFILIDLWCAPSATSPALIHRQILAFLIRPIFWLIAGAGIAAIWGLHVGAVLETPFGVRVTNALTTIGLTLILLTVLYETINSWIERHLGQRDSATKAPLASARALTLLPMLRGSIFILFSAIIILTFMSAVGINIAPLLAGAGVLGVAVGFGSQTLVKDFLTGLFIVTENTVAVGDVVKIGDFSGAVETLSIRAIRLRDIDGSLHIIPFGDVSKITNLTRGFAFALVDINVGYDCDLEQVMQVIREVGATLQEDAVFKRVILEPIEVMGVEKFGDSAVTIRARLRTRPGKQWEVRRLLLLRIKQRFDQEGIEMPFPTVTHITRNLPPVS